MKRAARASPAGSAMASQPMKRDHGLRRTPWLRDMTQDELLSAVGGERYHLVEVYADWCEACKRLGPALYLALAQLKGMRRDLQTYRIDGGAYPEVRHRYGVDQAPMLLLFGAGEHIAIAPLTEFLAANSSSENFIVSPKKLSTWMTKAIKAAAAASEWSEFDVFARCLLRDNAASYSHIFRPYAGSKLTLFGVCRNQTCVDAAHARRWAGRFSPVERASTTSIGMRSTDAQIEALGEMAGQRVVDIEEIVCDGGRAASERAAVRRARHAFATSKPLVLRNCASAMPAMHWWRNESLLRGRSPSAEQLFSPLLEGYVTREASSSGMLTPAHAWEADLRWPSPVSDELLSFTTTPHVWVSRGGKDAAMHFDTVDNFHVVLGDDKRFEVVSPADLPNMYIDFPPTFWAPQAGTDPAVRCPDRSVFGCDDVRAATIAPRTLVCAFRARRT